MKRFCVLLGLLLAAISSATVTKMVLKAAGTELGSATFDISLMPNGGIKTIQDIEVSAGGQTLSYKDVSIYDKTGRPLSTEETQVQAGKTQVVAVTYGPKAATVVVTANGKSTTKTLPNPKDGSIASPSEFWFVRDRPKKGTVDASYSVDPKTRTWTLEKTKYVGDDTLTVLGKKVTAHKITVDNRGTIWLDDKGNPYKILVNDSGQDIEMDRK